MPKVNKQKVLKGRGAVDAYRQAHYELHQKPWHRGIPEEHTPLLETLVDALEKLGFTSSETDFEPKKTEILAKFFDASELLNFKELGYKDRDDFTANATDADREALGEMWQ